MAFQFEQVRVTAQDQGSYVLTEAQRKAKLLFVDFEAYSTIGNDYYSYKSLPATSHYGYATLFYGSSVVQKIDLNFPRQRLYYHARWGAIAISQIHDWLIATNNWLDARIPNGGGPELNTPELEIDDVPADPLNIVKVLGERRLQFDLVIYWVPFEEGIYEPTLQTQDPSDPTDNQDQYPVPKTNPSNDPFDGNPLPTAPQANADPRDSSSIKPGDSGIYDVGWYYQPIGTNDGEGWRYINIALYNYKSHFVSGNGTKQGDLNIVDGSETITIQLWRNSFYSANCPQVTFRRIGDPPPQ